MCRAVDQDGEVVDVFLKARRDGKAAKRFFKCLLMNHTDEPRKIVTDKLRSYGDKNIRKFRVSVRSVIARLWLPASLYRLYPYRRPDSTLPLTFM